MKLALQKNIHLVPKTNHGFSLMEAAVGMGVMGTILVALLGGFTTGFFTMQMARENLRATQILLEKMETIRLYSWDQITNDGFIPRTFSAKYDPQGVAGAQGLTYTGTMTITNVPFGTSYADDLRLVKVTLKWKTGAVERNREFSSLVSRYGMQDYIY